MLRSMTGYGRGVITEKFGHITVEIQSVNRKHLEVITNLPREFQRFDVEIRKWISLSTHRGQVSVKVSASYLKEGPIRIKTNIPLAKEYKRAWDDIGNELHLPQNQWFSLEMLLPNINEILISEEDWKDEEIYRTALKQAYDQATAGWLQMKNQEGKALQDDIDDRLQHLQECISKIEIQVPDTMAKQKLKLQQRLMEWLPSTEEHEDRILREIILYTDKADISEEITRFKSHIEQCQSLLAGQEMAVGKTFEFLIQELVREVNTIGSKSSELVISHLVIDIKSTLEKVREQIQNVE